MQHFDDRNSLNETMVQSVVDQIIALCQPVRILLFSYKRYPNGEPSSFKLAVIAPFTDKGQTEQDIYLGIDSEISFDVLLYTEEEWQMLCKNPRSFAHQILQMGTVIYGC